MKKKTLIIMMCFLIIYSVLAGCTERETKVNSNDAPLKLEFAFSPKKPCANEKIDFTAFCMPKHETAVNWSWNFGDGTIGFTQNQTHIYTAAGRYTVTLVGTDPSGVVDSTFHNITVLYKMPTARFAYSHRSNATPENILTFTDNSLEGSAPIVNWSWDFGDGSAVSYGNITTHQFTKDSLEAGCFVTLHIKDANGYTDSISMPLKERKDMLLQIVNLKLNLEPARKDRYVDLCSCAVKNIGDKTGLFYIQAVDIDAGTVLMQCSDILTPNEELCYVMRGLSPSYNGTWHIGLRAWCTNENPPKFCSTNTQTTKVWSRSIEE